MTPLASWLLFGACILVGLVVYVVVAGGRRYRGMIEMLPPVNVRPEDAPPSADFPPIHIFGGIYDHEARRDFDGRWTFDHDPLIDHECEVCDARLRQAFNRLGDRSGTPRDADELMAAIREELET